MSTRALVLALGVSGFAVGLWLNTSLKPRSSYGEEIIVHRWVAYQFFPGYYQFQFWPNPGVPGATPAYPGPGLSLELEKAFGSALTQFFQRPGLSWLTGV